MRAAARSFGAALAVVALIPAIAEAQISPRRWQASLLVSSIRFSEFDPLNESFRREAARDFPLVTWWEPGLGVRLAFRLTDHLSVEGEASLFPRYADVDSVVRGRRGLVATGLAKGQVVGGIVVRQKLSGIEILGRVRPGAVSFSGFPIVFGKGSGGPPTLYLVVVAPATFPVFDIGGGVEKQLSSRIFVRFDLGDSMIWYRPAPSELNPHYWRHNLQLTGGVGFCF